MTGNWSLRPSDRILIAVGIAAAACMSTGFHLILQGPAGEAATARSQVLAAKLQLTDLSLFTEARYIRHLSMADRFSAFQDHPLSLEHFPSGSLIGPPAHLYEATSAISAAPSEPIGGIR